MGQRAALGQPHNQITLPDSSLSFLQSASRAPSPAPLLAPTPPQVLKEDLCLLPPGIHSLQFFATTVTQPGLREHSFIFVGFVDDTQFLCYNNQWKSQRMEPRVEWVKQMGPEYWEQQTRIVKHIETNSLVNFQLAMDSYNHSKDGE